MKFTQVCGASSRRCAPAGRGLGSCSAGAPLTMLAVALGLGFVVVVAIGWAQMVAALLEATV